MGAWPQLPLAVSGTFSMESPENSQSSGERYCDDPVEVCECRKEMAFLGEVRNKLGVGETEAGITLQAADF